MRSFLLSMVSWTSDKLDSSAFIEGYLVDNADLILTINRTDLEQTMVVQIADGTAKVEGDTSVPGQPASTLVVFDPRFEILPGTATRATEEDLTDYEVGPVQLRGE